MNRFWAFIMCLLALAPGLGHSSEAQLKEGNRLFRAGHYDQALKQYNDALIDTPQSSILRFNAGDAAYQMGDFSTAEKYFQETGDQVPLPVFRGVARYNQGNALFRQQKWKEAVEAYKDSLRANPQDEDAKYNLGVALNILKNPSKAPASAKASAGKPGDKKGSPSAKAKGDGGMSPQDAERLLAAAKAGEAKKKNQAPKAGAPHPDEDW